MASRRLASSSREVNSVRALFTKFDAPAFLQQNLGASAGGNFSNFIRMQPDSEKQQQPDSSENESRGRSSLLALASLDHACRDHCPGVSATLTTTAFDHSSSRWLGISDLIAEPEGPSLSLVQLRTAVWTGGTRDTRPNSDLSGSGLSQRQNFRPFAAFSVRRGCTASDR
jgi:hypothetical protein